jgi:hypothetical protein
MFFASLSLAWIAALAIAFICFPRITALVVIAIVYFGITGPYTQRVKRILATQNWRALNRTDWHSVRCMERS